MSRNKKSRKPGLGSNGTIKVKEEKSKLVTPAPRKPKKKTGKQAGNRQQEAKPAKKSGDQSAQNKDPRLGNKTPIALGGKSNPQELLAFFSAVHKINPLIKFWIAPRDEDEKLPDETAFKILKQTHPFELGNFWERIDGVITKGTAHIDESMITGESLSVQKTLDDIVIGATIVSDSTLYVRATAIGQDTYLSKIIAIVEQAQNSKPEIQKLADTIMKYFVPLVLVIAIC